MSPKTTPLLLVEEHLLEQVCVRLQDLVELLVICRFVKLAERLILMREVKLHSFLLVFPPTTGCLNLCMGIRHLFLHSLVSLHQCLQARTQHFGVSRHQAGDTIHPCIPFSLVHL